MQKKPSFAVLAIATLLLALIGFTVTAGAQTNPYATATATDFDTNKVISALGDIFLGIDRNNNSSANKLVVYNDVTRSQELLRIQENGFVGIGTTNPTAKLDVENGGIHARSYVSNDGYYVLNTGDGVWQWLQTLDGVAFRRPSGKDSISLTASGNVGIDIPNPSQKLEINGGLRLNTSSSKPACSTITRGTLWFSQGGAGDALEVCSTDNASLYAWRMIDLKLQNATTTTQ